MRLTHEPTSRRLKLRKAGFSESLCLDVDFAVMEFGESFEREMNATVEKTATRRKGPRKTRVPKWTPKELASKFLNVDTAVLDEIAAAHEKYVDELAEDVISGEADWLYNPGGE